MSIECTATDCIEIVLVITREMSKILVSKVDLPEREKPIRNMGSK